MRKSIFILIISMCVVSSVANAAVNIKKASSVATKKTAPVESATSLAPTVIGLIQGVQALKTQQQQLSTECAPTSDELNMVNELVKEWAKIGDTYAESACFGLGEVKCNGGTYSAYIQDADSNESCYETFESSEDKDMIWYGFPKASSAKKCDANGKNCTTVSNIYDVFNKISFGDADYTIAEGKKITSFKEKAEKCSPAKLKVAKRELAGGFLTQTLGTIGQSTGTTGTAAVLNAVSSMGGSGEFKSMLPSLGQMALQSLDK